MRKFKRARGTEWERTEERSVERTEEGAEERAEEKVSKVECHLSNRSIA